MRGDVRCRDTRAVILSITIPGYAWRHGVPRVWGFFIGTNLWSMPLLLSESLRSGGDLRRAWDAAEARRVSAARARCVLTSTTMASRSRSTSRSRHALRRPPSLRQAPVAGCEVPLTVEGNGEVGGVEIGGEGKGWIVAEANPTMGFCPHS